MLPDPIFLNVHMYGIMISLGIIGAFISLYLFGRKRGVDVKTLDFAFYSGVASVLLGMFSAAVFQGLYNYIETPALGFRLDGGLTFIGGLIGGVSLFLLSYLIIGRRLGVKMTDILPIAPCCITIAHGFGRIGCFFAGCCYGKTTDSFLGVLFPGMHLKVHPTQLYEAAFLFLLYALMAYLLLGRGFKHNMSLYLVFYGIFRFCLEFLRGDSRGELLGVMSPSQFWSLLMIAIGLALYFGLDRFFKKQELEKEKEKTE